jgi:hypothetical protein
LERRSGVTDINFDLETGIAEMLPGFGSQIDFAAIRDSIDESGFQLLALEIEVSGSLTQRQDPDGQLRPSLEGDGSGQRFWVMQGKTPGEQAAYSALMELAGSDNAKATIRGKALPDAAFQPSLVLTKISP